MRTALVALLAGAIGAAAARFGDMPINWAERARVRHAVNVGDADYLEDLFGCTLDEEIGGGKSMQCAETFLWLGPRASVGLALSQISNVQVEGYAEEARAFTANVTTRTGGRVDRGVIFDGDCHGNVESCIFRLGNGWEFRSSVDRLELVMPNGTTRDAWTPTARPRRP